ncbi:hypothetical protein N8517_03230, partial [Synechococcus sp. AH-601-L23]|nr:hypothetical protein [Synechococcus sp. AH-601-L23]
NGFNRILAELNNQNRDEYLGFLYQVSNSPQNNYAWSNNPQISEPCSAFSKTIPDWHSANVMLRQTGAEVLNKPSANLTTYFRLRNYEGPQGKSSAQFEVEGIVKPGGSSNNNEARSLLRRSLFVSSIVATDDDWAVLAGRDLDLGALRIDGKGMVLKLLPSLSNFINANSCNATNLLASANANNSRQPSSEPLANKIWPVANIGNNQWDLPTSTYFSGDGTTDEGSYEPGVQRIWAFDDRMVMDPSNPDEQNHGMTCGDRETYSIVCARPTSNQPDKDELHEIPIPSSQINKSLSSNGSIVGATISIKASDICNKFTQKNANVCQIFVEHVNLSKTRIHIENDTSRPIVLKLQLPNDAQARNDLTREYALSDSSIICGANSGEQSCNNKSELFVITADSGSSTNLCSNTPPETSLKFGGNNIPAALINWPLGSIDLNNDAKTKAIMWANSICTKGFNLTLDTSTDDNTTPIVAAAELQWTWDPSKRYGRTTLRGIRGTGFDTFSRW